ncbi:MAG: TldD/PmbA family protein [Candidatus Bathyarchaeia archaeon]|jgi:TldD protein
MDHLLKFTVDRARDLGAQYADARFQDLRQTLIVAENGSLRSYESDRSTGIGVRVLAGGSWGLASSTILEKGHLRKMASEAVRMAKVTKKFSTTIQLAQVKPLEATVEIPVRTNPDDVPPDVKVKRLLEANKAALTGANVKNSSSRLGFLHDVRVFVSSEGAEVRTDVTTSGFSQLSVAAANGSMERVPEQRSLCAGYEFIEGSDWNTFAAEVSQLASKVVVAPMPPPGTYPAIVDPELIGLFLHEALGHASEGDLVATKESVLEGRLGSSIASEIVTVYDDGGITGGYMVPFDDEGVPKSKTTVVEKGTLQGFLLSRDTATELGLEPTGNARAQNFENKPIVRMTNVYMQPGDLSFEELVKGIDYGFYLRGRGSLGGQVDVGGGTFTFRAGPSYLIEKGELKHMVRAVNFAGNVLETLKTIDAVGKDFAVSTSVFGGCGKDGQLAKVGDGGPHVRLGKVIIGGRAD